MVDLNQPLSDYKSHVLTFKLTEHMAGDKGIEPLVTESKSVVLPLHQSPIFFSVGLSLQSTVCSDLSKEKDMKAGASEGTRTLNLSRASDFKSDSYTSSDTLAYGALYLSAILS